MWTGTNKSHTFAQTWVRNKKQKTGQAEYLATYLQPAAEKMTNIVWPPLLNRKVLRNILNIHIYTHTHKLFGHSDGSLLVREVMAAASPAKLNAGGQREPIFPQKENFGFRFRRCRRNNGAAGERSYLPQWRVVLLIAVCCHNFAVFTNESHGDGGRHLF